MPYSDIIKFRLSVSWLQCYVTSHS